MFTIKRDSWHGRIVLVYGCRDLWQHRPEDLCSYVRSFLWGLLVIAWIIAVGVVLSWVLLAPLMWMIFDMDFPGVPIALLGTILWGCGATVGVVIGIHKLIKRWRYRRLLARCTGNFEPKPPSPFAQWIKDKRTKVCRTVEWV